MRTLRRVRTLHASLHTEVLEVELSSPSRGRRRLALKRAQPDAPDDVRVRLQHEATVGMQLDHPVLGAVLDFDLIHGQPSLLPSAHRGGSTYRSRSPSPTTRSHSSSVLCVVVGARRGARPYVPAHAPPYSSAFHRPLRHQPEQHSDIAPRVRKTYRLR